MDNNPNRLFQFNLREQDLVLIINLLGEQKYKDVFQLVNTLQQQLHHQMSVGIPQPPAPEDRNLGTVAEDQALAVQQAVAEQLATQQAAQQEPEQAPRKSVRKR